MGNPSCDQCGGSGKAVVRLEPTFDVRKMEVQPKEILGACDCVSDEMENDYQQEHQS